MGANPCEGTLLTYLLFSIIHTKKRLDTAQTVFCLSWRADEKKMRRYGSISVLLVFSSCMCVSNGHRLKGAWRCQTFSLSSPSQKNKKQKTKNNQCAHGLVSLLLPLGIGMVLELNLTYYLPHSHQRHSEERKVLSEHSIAHFFFLLVSQKSFCIRNSSRASIFFFFLFPISHFSHTHCPHCPFIFLL